MCKLHLKKATNTQRLSLPTGFSTLHDFSAFELLTALSPAGMGGCGESVNPPVMDGRGQPPPGTRCRRSGGPSSSIRRDPDQPRRPFWVFLETQGKESTCNAGDAGSILGSGRKKRPPGGGNGSPLQYSRMENPSPQRSHRGHTESDTTG